MIYFVLHPRYTMTIEHYIGYRARALADRIGILTYDQLAGRLDIPCSTLIFSDFDRLSAHQLDIVTNLFHQLRLRYPELHLMNDPAKFRGRYRLLRELHTRGINAHNVFKPDEPLDSVNFPVFIREEIHHTGALTRLIHDQRDLRVQLGALQLLGYKKDGLLISEYVDVRNANGHFQKYAFMRIDDLILASQLDISPQWMVKDSIGALFEPYADRFIAYARENPHRQLLQHVFDLAGADYGRVDYSIADGKPVVWEVNLNPDYGTGKAKNKSRWNDFKTELHAAMLDKYRSLDQRDLDISIELGSDEAREMAKTSRTMRRSRLHRTMATRNPTKLRIVKSLQGSMIGLAKAGNFLGII